MALVGLWQPRTPRVTLGDPIGLLAAPEATGTQRSLLSLSCAVYICPNFKSFQIKRGEQHKKFKGLQTPKDLTGVPWRGWAWRQASHFSSRPTVLPEMRRQPSRGHTLSAHLGWWAQGSPTLFFPVLPPSWDPGRGLRVSAVATSPQLSPCVLFTCFLLPSCLFWSKMADLGVHRFWPSRWS